MEKPLEFLKKVVKVRKHLIRTKRGYKDSNLMHAYLSPIDNWLRHWGSNATDRGALNIINLHELQIRELIPGGESGCGETMRQQLEEILKLDIMKQFNFTHKEVNYVARYTVDVPNQKVQLHGIFMPKSQDNIIAIVSPSITESLQAHLESQHLTHVA